MSIRKKIRERVGDGTLVYVEPLALGLRAKRHLFVRRPIMERVNAAFEGARRDDIGLGKLRADFDRFSTGGEITVGDDPYDKDNCAFMARTDPPQDGVFDIRSQDPKPAIRLFGCFAETDVFIGLTWRFRRELGGRYERLFDQAILAAIKEWGEIFPDHTRFYSEDIHDHISENIRVV